MTFLDRIKSELAYRRFQASAKASIKAARESHGKVNDVLAKQSATLHAALRRAG